MSNHSAMDDDDDNDDDDLYIKRSSLLENFQLMYGSLIC